MSKTRQFIMIFPDGNPLTKYNFADFLHDKRILVIDGAFLTPKNRLLKVLQRIHLSTKLNLIVNLPLKSLWGCKLDDLTWDINTEYIIISTRFSPIDIRYLKKRGNSIISNMYCSRKMHGMI